MFINPTRFTPLLKTTLEERELFFNLDSQGFLFAVIREQNRSYVATIKGIPNRQLDPSQIGRIRVLLKDECLILFEGKSIHIFPKLRGGFPPIGVDDCKDGPQALAEIGTTPLIFGGKTCLELLATALTGPFGGACTKGLTDLFYEVYKDSHEAGKHESIMRGIESILSKGGQIESELKILNDFYTSNIPKAKNLEKILSAAIERKAKEEGLQLLPQFVNLAGILYGYKDPKQGIAIQSIAQEMGTMIPAALTLSAAAAAPLAIKLGAVATILVGVASIGLALKRLLIDDNENPVIDSSMQIVQRILEQRRAEERAAFERVEKILGVFYIGLSAQLQDVQHCIASLNIRLYELESQAEITYQIMDRSFQELLGFQFRQKRGLVMHLANAGISASKAKKNACLFLDWAITQSHDTLLTGKNSFDIPPRIALKSKDAEFQIGYLNVYLARNFPALAASATTNGLIWSEAAHAYMELRLKTPQFNSEYASSHQEDFKRMVEVGLSLQSYIQTIQHSEPLFQHLVNRYRQAIQKIHLSFLKEQTLESETCRILFQELDDAYALIVAFCQLGFSRSIKTDPYFISLLYASDESPHGFRNSEAIKQYCYVHGNWQWHALNEALFETSELFLRALELKREALFRDNVSDDSVVVEITLLKLNAFWKTVFAKDDLINQSFHKPTHTIPLEEMCEENLLASAKYGLLNRVSSLLRKGADIDQTHPLDLTKRTPLHYAALYGHEEVVEYLIDRGASLKRDFWGMTPLDLAKSEAIKRLLLPHTQQGSLLDALLVGKQFQHRATFSCLAIPAASKQMFSLHVAGSKLVSVQNIFKLQLMTRQWNLLDGKLLKIIPNGANGIRGSGSIALFPGGAVSIVYDFSKETLTMLKLAEKVCSNPLILPDEQCIINQTRAGGPFSILSTETGQKIDQLDIGPHSQATLCHYCPSIGNKAVNPFHLPTTLPPFIGHPQSLLIRKVNSGVVSYEIWHLPSKNRRLALELREGEGATEVSISKTHAAFTFKQGGIRVFDLATSREVHRVTSSPSQTLFGLWNDKLVASLQSRELKGERDFGIWAVGEEKPLHVFQNITNMQSKWGFIKEGILLLRDTHKNAVFLYDLEKSEELGYIHVGNHYIVRAELEGEIVILSAYRNQGEAAKLFFYQLRTQKLLQELSTGDNYAFSEDTLVTHNAHTSQFSVWKI